MVGQQSVKINKIGSQRRPAMLPPSILKKETVLRASARDAANLAASSIGRKTNIKQKPSHRQASVLLVDCIL